MNTNEMNMARLLRQKEAEIEQLQRKLMLVTNFPSHPGGHPDDQSEDAMVPADWRHGWICAVAAIQEAIGGKGAVVNQPLTTGETSERHHLPPPPPPIRVMHSGLFGQYESKESIEEGKAYDAFMRGYMYALGRPPGDE